MHVALNQVTIDKLHAFGRRRKMLIVVRGFCAGIVALLGVMSIVALLDRFIVLGDTTRLMLSGAGYLTVIGVAWLTCIRMIMRIPSEKELARLVETVSPELREDLVSAVELGAPNSDARYDSEVFRRLLQQDVASKMESVKVERLLPPGLIGRWVRFACLVLTLCVGLMLIPGLEFGNMLTRALIPMANVDRVSNVRVKLVAPNPADPLVPHNEAVDIIVEHVAGTKPDQVTLETFRLEEGREDEALVMKPTGTPNQYAATVQIGREPVTYRVLAGDAVTKKYTITTASRPHVNAFSKTYQYPQYTRRPDQTVSENHGDIRSLQGSTVELVMQTDQPVTAGELRIESPGQPLRTVPLTVSSENEVRAAVKVDETATYKVHLVARDTGFSNPFDPQYEIVADPDRPPTVELRQPLQNLLIPGDEIVRMFAVATDDMGLDTVAQMIRVNEGRWIEVIVAENAGRDVQLRRNLDLFDLAVKPGDRVQSRFAATDFGGNKAESTVVTVTVSSTGFDPNRFNAIKAKQQVYAALAQLKSTTEDYSRVVRQGGQRLRDGALQRQQALANMADAAEQIQQQADATLTEVTNALRVVTAGSEAYDLVLVGRLASRVRDDWSKTIAGAAARAAATDNADVINAEAERAQQAVVSASQALTEAEIGFRHILASDEADTILRDLISLSQDQTRIDPALWPDEPDTWQRLARRQSAVAAQLRLVDEVAAKLAARGDSDAFERIADAMNHWMQPRAAAEQALADRQIDDRFGPRIQGMTRGLDQAKQVLLPAAKELAEIAAVDGRARIERAVAMLAPHIHATHAAAGEAYDAQQLLFDQRARGAGENTIARVESQADAAKARNADIWQGAIDQFKTAGTLHESRSDSDSQFVADIGLTRRATQALRVKYDSPEAREAVASLRVIANAFRTLEAGHGVAELLAGVKAQAAREKWLRTPSDALTLHPRDWDWASMHMKQVADHMRDAELPDAAVDLLRQTRLSDQAGRVGREMSRRRATGAAQDKQDADLDAIAKQLAKVHQLIEADMDRARRLIAEQAPTVSQMMAKLADDAEQLAHDAQQARQNVADDEQPDEPSKEEVAELAQKQDALNEQLEDLASALREQANVEDVFTDEGRENARDADDALAMIKQPAEQADQAVQQADAQIKADQQPEASLEAAAEQDQQLAQNLRQLAEHFENVEQGKGEQTRAALRDAEQDLGVKRDLDQEFGRMAKLAEIAKLDPQDQLKALENELANNPAMKRELSDIARDAVAEARDQLDQAAAQEKRIAQDLEAANANDQQRNPQVEQRLKQIAQKAEQMAVNEVAKVAEHSLKGAPNAQQPLNEAMKALEQAGDAVDPQKPNPADPNQQNQAGNPEAQLAKQAQALQNALQDAADNLKQANQNAEQDAQAVRKAEREATAQLAIGDATPEQRIAAAEVIRKAPKQQEAARATRDAADVVAKDAQKLADEAAQLARDLQRVAEQNANNLEHAAKQQQPIGEAVANAEDNVARAARHEERLGNEQGAEQLDQANKQIEKAGDQVAKAEQQLARADTQGSKQAVNDAQKQLDKQRDNLDQILGQPQPRYSDEDGNPLPDAPQGNPIPDDPQPGDSKQGDPNQSEPKSGDGKHAEPKSGKPKHGEGKHGEPKSGEPKHGEGKHGEPKSGEPKSGDGKHGESKSGDPKSGQPKGGQPGQGEPKNGQPKNGQPDGGSPAIDPNQFAGNPNGQLDRAMKNAADALEAGQQSPQDQAAAKWMARALDQLDQALNPSDPANAMAARQPQQGQPGQGQPGQGQPGQGQPGQGQPGQGQPGQGQPGQGQPGQGQPGQGQPGQGQPGQGQPGQGQPGQGQPDQGQPGQGQPGQAALAQATEAVRQAAQAQAQAMAQARQAGATPGQQGQPGQGQPGQGQPGQGQSGQGQQGQPIPGQMAQGQGQAGQGQGQNQGQQPGQQPAGQGTQSGQGAAVAAAGQAVGQLPDQAAIKRGDWGKLPPKLAEDLLEGQRNGVAPEYRDLVEAYFRAIAKKARDTDNPSE